jgi:Piwi domain.
LACSFIFIIICDFGTGIFRSDACNLHKIIIEISEVYRYGFVCCSDVQVNHRFPDRVVIYRDGVGDGQLKVSADYEVPQFESCFQHVSPDYHPKLTVVVCHKRINTRIFSSLVSC